MTNLPDKYGFRFRNWPIYKDARDFRKEINKILRQFPREELYALTDQTKRAINSVILNLAEGSNKNSNKDKRVYINRAQGSMDEIVACLDCALDEKYLSAKLHNELLLRASEMAKQLKAFGIFLVEN